MLETLENTALAAWVRESPSLFAYTLVLSVHAIGLAIVVGTNTLIALRLLGFSPALPLASLRRFYPVIWFGFTINAMSGVLLFIAEARSMAKMPAFWGKLGFVAIGMTIAMLIKSRLMKDDTGTSAISDWRNIAAISNQLKQVALAHNARIIAASQINREGINSRGRPPKLENLTGSDALGQDADVVLTMARMASNVTWLSMEKNRHGPSSVWFYTKFDADHGDYREITLDEARDLRDNDDSHEY